MASPEPPHVPVIPPPRFFFGVSLGAAILFVIWTCIVRPWEEPPAFDVSCADYWHDFSVGHPGALGYMQFLTELGGIACVTMLTVMGSIWQTAIKHKTLAIAWLAIVLGGAIFNQGVKESIGRDRPPNPASVVHEKNNSYPSGHSMGSLIGYGLLGYALILPQRRRPRRIVAINLMIVIVLAIGFSRMYLRAHWFSDVVGGFSLGIAWLFLCLGWLERRRLRLLGAG
jgi:undecaprenyl-diphosphatase